MSLKKKISDFLARELPQTKVTVDEVGPMSAIVRHEVGPLELRPGGSVSGPILMTVADVALYVAILGEIGLEPLTVTTNLNMNFLRKPSAGSDIIGECRLLKLGSSLAVGEVTIYSEGMIEPVAHAMGTYSLPPR